MEVTQFAKDDVKVKIMTKIPVSGWSYDEGKRCLVENDDPTAFGAGAIQFEVRENVEKFDFYKDDFENYQDIEDRVIGGITFRGRTYRTSAMIGFSISHSLTTAAPFLSGSEYGLRSGNDARHHSQQHDVPGMAASF